MTLFANLAEFKPDIHNILDRVIEGPEPRAPLPRPSRVIPVGHRGTKTYAPENTIIAHETAYQMGARCIEMDIRATKDNHFVVIHDHDVDRTTDVKGKVSEMTLADIQKLDAGSHKSPAFEGTQIPTLREALRNVQGRFAIDIDFKGGPEHSAAMIAEILENEGFTRPDAPLVTIFCRSHHFQLLRPLVPKFALRPHFVSRRQVRELSEMGVEVMGLRRYSFTPHAAHAIRKGGMILFSNVMGRHDNEKGYKDALQAGSLFIQTDDIKCLVKFLKTRNCYEPRVLGRDFFPVLPSQNMAA